ncbi:MAG: hypothetical protein QXY45_01945 [Candidatus Aenigmatarchaeota archaeon]
MRFKIFLILIMALVLITFTYGFEEGNKNMRPSNRENEKIMVPVAGGSVGIGPIVVNNSNITYNGESREYLEDLEIRSTKSRELIENLMERKRNKKENYLKIVRVSKSVKEDDREIIANELLKIDEKFVEKLDRNMNDKKIKNRVSSYVEEVRERKKFQVKLNETQIEELFKNRITLDEFLNNFLKNLN